MRQHTCAQILNVVIFRQLLKQYDELNSNQYRIALKKSHNLHGFNEVFSILSGISGVRYPHGVVRAGVPGRISSQRPSAVPVQELQPDVLALHRAQSPASRVRQHKHAPPASGCSSTLRRNSTSQKAVPRNISKLQPQMYEEQYTKVDS